MQYKVVPFAAAISNTGDASTLASQVENLISSHASNGWEFDGVYQLETYKAGSSGCFGIGATPATTIPSEFIVMRKP